MKNLLKLSIIILLNQYALTEEELIILEKKVHSTLQKNYQENYGDKQSFKNIKYNIEKKELKNLKLLYCEKDNVDIDTDECNNYINKFAEAFLEKLYQNRKDKFNRLKDFFLSNYKKFPYISDYKNFPYILENKI